MAIQQNYGSRDPNERSCRTCRYWSGDRSWPFDKKSPPAALCGVPLPPYLQRRGPSQTTATQSCLFHDYSDDR